MHTVVYTIELEDENVRSAVFRNLQIESEESRTGRANFQVTTIDHTVKIEIEAKDLVMLRAFSNSVFRILKTCIEVADVVV